jgi:hypothetical protein
MSIYIPKKLSFLVIKKENNYILIIYNINFYFIIKIKKIIYYKLSKLLLLNNLYCKDSLINTNCINNFISSWDIFFIKKLKFKGKGYKILTKKNLLIFSFNHSHITWFLFFNIICRKYSI